MRFKRPPQINPWATQKAGIVTQAMLQIFEAEDKRYRQEVEALLIENQKIIETSHNLDWLDIRKVGAMVLENQVIAPDLKEKFEHITQFRRTVEHDKFAIGQFLMNLLSRCLNLQEVRDALPECIVVMLPSISYLYRSKLAEQAFIHDPRALQRYEKFVDKINTYCAMKFLYPNK